MTRVAWISLAAATLAAAGACRAGPSVFDRKATTESKGRPVDSAWTTRAAEGAAGPEAPDTADAGEHVPAVAQARGRVPGDGSAMEADPASSPADSTGGSAMTGAGSAAGRAPARADSGSAPGTEASEGPTAGSGASKDVPRFTRPKHVRGIYLNAWTAGSSRRLDALTALAARTEINTFVIDIKDATGYVSHPTQVPMAKEIGADGQVRIRDLPGLLLRLHRDGIYPIARIVVVKDPLLTEARPDLAVHDTTGHVFRDDKGIVWVNPYSHTVWDYEVALAREVARMGFPEIQWDYIRFPDIPEDEKGVVVYPGADDRTKAQVIAGFMSYSRKSLGELGARVTADVFGVTASATRDVGIGQVWDSFIDHVDVAQPMVYPSHYWKGSFGYQTPNAYPYEVVRHALADALRQSAEVPGAGAVRPWLQDFTLGKPPYGAPEVRAQIQATYDSGIEEWFLWNPGSSYTESALEPKGGFKVEPRILVDGHVVPVSKRWEFVDSADGQDLRPAADSAGSRPSGSSGDSTPRRDTTAARDTTAEGDTAVAPDTAAKRDSTVARDTTVVRDTMSARDTTVAPDTSTGIPRSPGACASARVRRRIP